MIDFDFPQMKNAKLSEESEDALNALFELYANFEKNGLSTSRMNESISQLNLISKNREFRLNASESELSGWLYFI